MADVFWDIWKGKYLQSLMTRQKWKTKQRNLEVEDFVLLTEQHQPRREWTTGTVTETYPGKDDLVRVVKIRTASGEFKRAVHQLCLLEAVDAKTEDPASLVSGEDGTAKTC